jgi:hypothetical protein
MTPADLADLIGRTPPAGPVGRIAIACLDDDSRPARWAAVTAEALAGRGVGVLLVDLTPAGTGWHGVSEVAGGGAQLPDVLDHHPYLPIASVGPGADRDRAVNGLAEAIRDVPSELAVVLVVLRNRDLRRRRGAKALRSGWFDQVLIITGSDRRRDIPRLGDTPVEVVVIDDEPPEQEVAAVRPVPPVRRAREPGTRPSPADPAAGEAPTAQDVSASEDLPNPEGVPAEEGAPSTPDDHYRSATVRVLPPPERSGTPDPPARPSGTQGEGEGPRTSASQLESRRYSPHARSAAPPVTDRGQSGTGDADEEVEAGVSPETAVADDPIAEREDTELAGEVIGREDPSAAPPGPQTRTEPDVQTEPEARAEPGAPAKPEAPDTSSDPGMETLARTSPEDIWTHPDEARGEHGPHLHAEPLIVEPDLASRIWRDDEGGDPRTPPRR